MMRKERRKNPTRARNNCGYRGHLFANDIIDTAEIICPVHEIFGADALAMDDFKIFEVSDPEASSETQELKLIFYGSGGTESAASTS